MLKIAISLLLVGFCGSCNAKDSILIQTLANEMAVHKAGICVGFERIEGFKGLIVGKEAIDKARENWESLAKAAHEQTDYEIDVTNGDVLIRPKVAPEVYEAPFALKKVRFSEDPIKWNTVEDAVKSLKFEDSSVKLTFDLPDTFGAVAYSGKANIKPSPQLALKFRQFVEPSADSKDLSRVLFLMARCLGAKQWTLGPNFPPVFKGQEPEKPTKFQFAYLTFTGNLANCSATNERACKPIGGGK